MLSGLLAAAVAFAPPPAVTIEADPAALARHPLVAGVWAELAAAPPVRGALARTAAEAVREPLRLLAGRLSTGPFEAAVAATAGGVRLELPAVGGGPAGLSVAADSAETRRAVVAAARAYVAREAGPAAALLFPPDSAGPRPWPLGEDATVWLDGPRVDLAANGAARPAPPALPPGTLLRIAADVPALRAAGSLPPGLGPPWADGNLGSYLGGYAAALDESPGVSLTLSDSPDDTSDSRGLRLSLRLAEAQTETDIPGFFASPNRPVPAPLAVPGAIYSASWLRDYGTLWDARRDLLTAAAADRLEEQDREVRQGVKVLGADVLPSDLFASLGDSWRVVLVSGAGSDYAVEPFPALPAAGLAVSLRDPAAFDRLAGPLLRGVRLVAAFGGAKMQPFAATETVGGADVSVSGLRFAETPAAARVGDRVRFNAAPAWATFRGHFVAAGNRPALRVLLEALDAEAAAPSFLPPGVTEEQRFAPAALADALIAAGPAVAARLTLEGGFSPAESDATVAAVAAALRRVGPVTLTTDVSDGLRMTLDVRPPGDERPPGDDR